MRYVFKVVPDNPFPIQPYHQWMNDLREIMQDQSFTVQDIMFSLGIDGREAMSLLTYMLFDCRTVRLDDA